MALNFTAAAAGGRGQRDAVAETSDALRARGLSDPPTDRHTGRHSMDTGRGRWAGGTGIAWTQGGGGGRGHREGEVGGDTGRGRWVVHAHTHRPGEV